MSLLDEYGAPRITAADWAVINENANAVIRHQNRHVMAFSLRAVRKLSYHKLGIYFGVSTERATAMAVIGFRLLLTSPVVQERFPDLSFKAEIITTKQASDV